MNDLTPFGNAVEAPARFTIDEFMQLVGSPVFLAAGKVELVEGLIVRMSPAQSPHMYYQREVMIALHEIFSRDDGGYIVQPELSLQLGAATLRDADIGVIEAFGPEVGFPDPSTVLLVVEIAHASLAKDMTSKRFDYARAGIPHYWVVDVDKRRVHVMTTPLDGDYAERHPVAFGEPLAVPATDRTIVID